MGFLSRFFSPRPAIQALPSGSLTVDGRGQIVTSTVSSAYPKPLLEAVGRDILELLAEARTAQMPLAEVSLHYGSLHITGRELRDGAVIFLYPQTALLPTPSRS